MAVKPEVIQRYMNRVGTRSMVFQAILLVWTIFMWGVTAVLVIIATASVSHFPSQREWDNMNVDQKASFQIEQSARRMNPDAARAGDGMAIGSSFICPISIWGIIALPLLIATIATTGKSRPPVKPI